MMKVAAAVIVTAFLTFPSAAPAQEIGVKAGFNSASLTPEEDEDPDLSRRFGLPRRRLGSHADHRAASRSSWKGCIPRRA